MVQGDGPLGGCVGSQDGDIKWAYDGDNYSSHAIFFWNEEYADVAFVALPFSEVTDAQIAELTFCDHINDPSAGCQASDPYSPLGPDRSVVVHTGTGRYFKVGYLSESDVTNDVTFEFAELTAVDSVGAVSSDEGNVESDKEVVDESSEEIPIRTMMRGAEDGGEGSDVDGEVRSEELGEEVTDPDQIIYMMTGVVDEPDPIACTHAIPPSCFYGEEEVTDRSVDEDSGEPIDDSEIVYFGDDTSEEEVMYTLTATGRYDWYNDSDPLDTNGDGAVSPIDVLLVMEALDRSGSTELTNAMRPNSLLGEEAPGDQAYYLDGNDDSYVSPIDVLLRVHFFTGDTAEEATLDSGRLMADPTGQFDDSSDTSLSIIADESLGLVADESGDAFWEGDDDLDGTRMAMPVDESESGDEKPDSETLDDFWGTYPADSDEVFG